MTVSLTMTRVSTSRAVLVAVVGAIVLVVGSGCSQQSPQLQHGLAKVFSVGDCVAIPSKAPTTLSAEKVACGADPSYTVGAVADAAVDVEERASSRDHRGIARRTLLRGERRLSAAAAAPCRSGSLAAGWSRRLRSGTLAAGRTAHARL